MIARTGSNPGRKNQAKILAMFLIGAGLMLLGGLSLALILNAPRPSPSAAEPQVVAAARPAAVDFAAPDLSLNDLNGNPVSLAGLTGQVVLVNNWATWCPPCKAEMPTLQAYYEAHRQDGFTIVAIEAGEAPGDVAAFVDEYKLTFPVWPDPQQKALSAFRNLDLPSSYVLDRQGRVRLAWTGAISPEALEQYVSPLLED